MDLTDDVLDSVYHLCDEVVVLGKRSMSEDLHELRKKYRHITKEKSSLMRVMHTKEAEAERLAKENQALRSRLEALEESKHTGSSAEGSSAQGTNVRVEQVLPDVGMEEKVCISVDVHKELRHIEELMDGLKTLLVCNITLEPYNWPVCVEGFPRSFEGWLKDFDAAGFAKCVRNEAGEMVDATTAVPAFYVMAMQDVCHTSLLPHITYRLEALEEAFKKAKKDTSPLEYDAFQKRINAVFHAINEVMIDESIREKHRKTLQFNKELQEIMKDYEDKGKVPRSKWREEWKRRKELEKEESDESWHDIPIIEDDETDMPQQGVASSSSSSSSSQSHSLPRSIVFYRDAAPRYSLADDRDEADED
jgi:hypothetical protein